MFTPLDILYIVLAFCVLWITAALFWLVWQVATVIRTVNDAVAEAKDKMRKIEETLSFIKERFEKATSTGSILVEGVKKIVDYAIDKKRSRQTKNEDVWENK
jgi:hypothetical protein